MLLLFKKLSFLKLLVGTVVFLGSLGDYSLAFIDGDLFEVLLVRMLYNFFDIIDMLFFEMFAIINEFASNISDYLKCVLVLSVT